MYIPQSSNRALRRAGWAMAVLCLGGMLALTVDMRLVSIGHEVLASSSPVLWTLCELFGDAQGVVLIVLVIFLFSRATRPYLPRVVACAFGGGLAADVVKLLVVRVRPRAFDLQGGVLQSFHGFRLWVPLHHGSGLWDSGLQSFPSAHTATAVGLAVGLAWLWPRGRNGFLALAMLVACQRVVVSAHFLSDTLIGAAVGGLVAAYCIDRRGLGQRFDRWEERLRAASLPEQGTHPARLPVAETVNRELSARYQS